MTNSEYRKYRESSEKIAFKDVFKEFKKISKDINTDGINNENVDERVNEAVNKYNIEKVLFALWLLVGFSYSKSVFKQFTKWEIQDGLAIPKNRLQDFKIAFGAALIKYPKKKKIEGIIETYVNTVKKTVEQVTATALARATEAQIIEPITERELRNIIQSEVSKEVSKIINKPDFYAGESQRIAVTETTFGINSGNDLASDFTEIKVLNQWITFVDGRERPWHREANLVTVPKGTLFTVNGEKLMYPGDGQHGATASNLANCRCRSGYRKNRSND